MAERKAREFVVQPLPVKDFAIKRSKRTITASVGSLPPTRLSLQRLRRNTSSSNAAATCFGFHKIGETGSTHFDVRTTDNEIHSFRIIATNDGGLSFRLKRLPYAKPKSRKTQC